MGGGGHSHTISSTLGVIMVIIVATRQDEVVFLIAGCSAFIVVRNTQ